MPAATKGRKKAQPVVNEIAREEARQNRSGGYIRWDRWFF